MAAKPKPRAGRAGRFVAPRGSPAPATAPGAGPVAGLSEQDAAEMDVEYEHALWACAQGLRPAEVVHSVHPSWPPWRDPNWHDAVAVLRWARRTILAPGSHRQGPPR